MVWTRIESPGSDWHFSVRTADGEVLIQGNNRVHTDDDVVYWYLIQ